MNTKKASLLMFCVLVFSALSATKGWGDDWQYYTHSDKLEGYYNASKIKQVSKGIFQVWVKWDWTPEGVKWLVENFFKVIRRSM